jgi:monoamine oxidase
LGLQTGDVAYTSDATVVLPNGRSQAAIIIFILGDAARRWSEKSLAERQKMVLHSLVKFFDEPRMWFPQEYIEQDWCVEEYQGGGYHCSTPPGVLTSYGRSLYTPIGRIHWAGTESADRWLGYMEGAVSSAERVVSEILRHPRERPKL